MLLTNADVDKAMNAEEIVWTITVTKPSDDLSMEDLLFSSSSLFLPSPVSRQEESHQRLSQQNLTAVTRLHYNINLAIIITMKIITINQVKKAKMYKPSQATSPATIAGQVRAGYEGKVPTIGEPQTASEVGDELPVEVGLDIICNDQQI